MLFPFLVTQSSPTKRKPLAGFWSPELLEASELTVTLSSPRSVSRYWPFLENATALTRRLYPSSVCRYVPVAISQSRTVSSCEADASVLPSGENATAVTELL